MTPCCVATEHGWRMALIGAHWDDLSRGRINRETRNISVQPIPPCFLSSHFLFSGCLHSSSGCQRKGVLSKLGLIGKGFDYVPSPPSSPRERFSYKNFRISLNIVYFHNKHLSRWSLMGLRHMLVLNKAPSRLHSHPFT